MRLAAIYIHEHFIFGEAKTFNFGSKYYYSIKSDNKRCSIFREHNNSFIENFFSASSIENITAIVGANGVGKTSIITEMAQILNSRHGSNSVIIFESGEEIILHNYSLSEKIITNIKYKIQDIDLATIYYSPFLDFKNPVAGIDISYDALISRDTENIEKQWQGGEKINFLVKLKQGNYFRIRSLKNSPYSNEIQDKFDFPQDDLHRVTFTRYRIDADNDKVNFDETPEDFRSYLDELFVKIRGEYRDINRNTSNNFELFSLQKSLFKNLILMDIFCLLVYVMEMKNTYLSEGHFRSIKYSEIDEIASNNTGYEMLILWLNDHYYKLNSIESRPLPQKEVSEFLKFIYDYIDNLEPDKRGESDFFDWHTKSLFFEEEDLTTLLNLNQNLLSKLSKYYLKSGLPKEEPVYQRDYTVHQFINLEPSVRNLSSGETAMLNLFSRIYDHFLNNVINVQLERKSDFYILLLDEADMGFHPRWKREFVTMIINFAENLFSEINSKVQIIFTTHDPLTLSDIPNPNIIYIRRSGEERKVLQYDDLIRPKRSFGANIHDLLADSFFMEDGFMGKFAETKINELIEYLTSDSTENLWLSESKSQTMINIIDEPIIRERLQSLHDKKFLYADKAALETRILQLQNQLMKLDEKNSDN